MSERADESGGGAIHESGTLVDRRRAPSFAAFESKGTDGSNVVKFGDREFRQVTAGRAGVVPILASLARSAASRMRPDVRLWFPPLVWARKYTRNMALSDLAAGVTVGTLLIPQAVAFAQLANIPAINGLYTAAVPMLVYSLLASSSKVNSGPTSPTAVLLASVAASQGVSTPEALTAVVVGVTLVSGIVQMVMGVVGMGLLLASLLSWPVMSAFLSGAAVITVCSQVRARARQRLIAIAP